MITHQLKGQLEGGQPKFEPVDRLSMAKDTALLILHFKLEAVVLALILFLIDSGAFFQIDDLRRRKRKTKKEKTIKIQS